MRFVVRAFCCVRPVWFRPSAIAVGFTLAIPIWLVAMCFGFLARTGGRAWIWCGALTLLFGGLAFGIGPG